MFCFKHHLRLFTIGSALCIFLGLSNAKPKPDAIGDILGELLSLGLPVTHFDMDLSVLGLLVGSASLDFNVTNPLPLIEMTIDQATMQLGQNGTTFFSFNHTFTNFVVPGLSSANSGTIGSVALTQGGLATLPLIATTSLDIIGAQYSVRVLSINGTGGVATSLSTVELGVPTTTSVQLLKE